MSDKFPNHNSKELEEIQKSINHYLNNPPDQTSERKIHILKTILKDIETSIKYKNLLDEKVDCIYCNGTGYAKDPSYSFDGQYCINCYGKGYIN